MKEKETPMMRQYLRLKEEHQDKVLFFRLGDFYEMFFSDAIEVSKLLNLTLTHRGTMPMCGIPYHAANNYIKRLLDAGKKVAVSNQVMNEENSRELAERKVTEIYTPATVVEDDYLDSLSPSNILSVFYDKKEIFVSWSDITSGEFRIKKAPHDRSFSFLESLLVLLTPKEILVSDDQYYTDKEFRLVIDQQRAIVTKLPNWSFSLKDGKRELNRQFGEMALSAFSIDEEDKILYPIGALLGYLFENAKKSLPQIRSVEWSDDSKTLFLDSAAVRNLELIEAIGSKSKNNATLFNSLNRTKTSSGARYLKNAILHPLFDKEMIEKRLGFVSYFIEDKMRLEEIRKTLSEIADMERLSSKASMEKLYPRDFISSADAITSVSLLLARFPDLISLKSDLEGELNALIAFASDIYRGINRELNANYTREDSILDGYDSTLDELRSYSRKGNELVDEYIESLKRETGLNLMRISENRIIGKFIEVPKGQAERVPSYFIKKQILVNVERFTTRELESLKDKLISSEEDALKREREVYDEFLDKARHLSLSLSLLGSFISILDFYTSLSALALEKDYVRPVISDSESLKIVNGRHPIVEDFTGKRSYVPNSFSTEKSRFTLLTGPNMAGKSTYLREVALIVLMSHMGSFVPAESAEIPMTDKIFCRVGASDNISRGESTFLLEMTETASILRLSTRKSLVIMDEIGRGTSTEDGMSLAYAIKEYLVKLGAITLFATHYHELTLLDTSGLQLLNMAVKEEKGEIEFLRKAVEGTSSSSYGIFVSKMAGLPKEVIREAREFQRLHFQDYSLFDKSQGDLFIDNGRAYDEKTEKKLKLLDRIADFDIDSSRPIDAFTLISDIKDELEID